MRNLLKIILISLMLLPLSLFAQDNGEPKDQFCPDVSLLKKDPTSKTWNAEHKQWKSYEVSFVNKITSFLGAQWVGANVGQISCLYASDEPKSFPVILVFRTLTYAPKGGRWSDDQGGYRNCRTTLQSDCPFRMRMKSKEDSVNQQLEQLKSLPGKQE